MGNFISAFKTGKKILKDDYFSNTENLSRAELAKRPTRTEIINFFLSKTPSENYLEIGVRNPDHNFAHISCKQKTSVDPGLEFAENPVDYQMTSDAFFKALSENKTELDSSIRFDVVFIDGLHLAGQVEKDIENSLAYIKDEGFVILHDCNPPTYFHQREDYGFRNSPAKAYWNGTTWKAFYRYRHVENLYSICFDTDWGVGVISKKEHPGFNNLEGPVANSYFEYHELEKNRKEHLNLTDFLEWEKNQ
jgi:hypothetical protein